MSLIDQWASLGQLLGQASGDYSCVPSLPNIANYSYTVTDDLVRNQEDKMDMDFEGGVKKLGDHYLLKLGCKYHIVHDSKEAAKVFAEAFKEQFEKKE